MNYLLGPFCSVFGTALFSVLNADGIEGSTNDMVSHPWKILDSSSSNQDNGVFLEVVSNAGDVGGDFNSIG